jgi:hypothetical protein
MFLEDKGSRELYVQYVEEHMECVVKYHGRTVISNTALCHGRLNTEIKF